jgi:hypothetical protein
MTRRAKLTHALQHTNESGSAGHLSAPDEEATEDKAAEQFGITGERRKRLVFRPRFVYARHTKIG